MVIYCWSMYYVWLLKYVKMHGNKEARLVLKSCHHFIYGTQWLEKKMNVEKGKDCQRSFSTRSRAHCYNTCNFSMFRALHQQFCNPLRSKFWFAQDDASIFMPPCHIYAPHGIIWLCRQFFFAQPVLRDKRFSTSITQLLPIKWILPLLRTRSFIAPCDNLRRGGGSAELEEPAQANQFNPPASEKERPG